MKKKLHKLFVFLLLCQLHVAAQTEGYNYEATIKPVDSSGFYNIVLTPELNAHLKTDYSDLRIVNDSGKWVPHLVREPNKEQYLYPVTMGGTILKNETINNTTQIVVAVGVKGVIEITSDLIFEINNSLAERYCTLTGSYDMKSWFIINDSIKILGESKENSNTTNFTLRFPPVNYKFFKVSINNKGTEGFKVVRVSTTINENVSGITFHIPSIKNPSVKILQKDSSKFSFIRIDQDAEYHFNELAVKVSGVKYFNRRAKLYIPASSKHSFANPGSLVADLDISNNSTLQFNVLLSKAKTFYIIVHNEDNLPLKVDEVKTAIDYRLANVFLEKGKSYKLLLNNSTASAPNYDLSLKDIRSKELHLAVTISKISSIQKPTAPPQPKDNSKKLIWLVIAIAAIVLTFFTYRLVTDMNKSKS